MTIREAIAARIQPYTLPDDTIEVIATDCGIEDIEDDYESEEFRVAVTKAVIAALEQLVTLTREQDHGSTQTYDPEKLLERIASLKRGIEEEDFSKPTNIDITEYW